MARPMPRAAHVTTTTRPVGPPAMVWVAGVVVTCSSLMVVAARRPRDSWGAAARTAIRVRCDATPAAEPAPRAAGHRDAAVLVGFLQSPRRPGFPGGPTTDVDWLDDRAGTVHHLGARAAGGGPGTPHPQLSHPDVDPRGLHHRRGAGRRVAPLGPRRRGGRAAVLRRAGRQRRPGADHRRHVARDPRARPGADRAARPGRDARRGTRHRPRRRLRDHDRWTSSAPWAPPGPRPAPGPTRCPTWCPTAS